MTDAAGWQQAAIRLETGLQILGFTATGQQRQQLLFFLQLLQRWNRISNMTTVTAPEQMVSWHLLDSLCILPWLQGQEVLDMGSGAGLPGLPLAIMVPDKTFVLLDSRRKRTRFLIQAVAELGLKNVAVVTARLEQYPKQKKFATLTARAFAPLAKILQNCAHLCTDQSRILVMQGRQFDQELLQLPENWQVQSQVVLTVPGLNADRSLLVLQQTLAGSNEYEDRQQ